MPVIAFVGATFGRPKSLTTQNRISVVTVVPATLFSHTIPSRNRADFPTKKFSPFIVAKWIWKEFIVFKAKYHKRTLFYRGELTIDNCRKKGTGE